MSPPHRRQVLRLGIGTLLALSAVPFFVRWPQAQGIGGGRVMSLAEMERETAARSFLRTVALPDDSSYTLMVPAPKIDPLPERERTDRFTTPDRPAR
ncbi:MAG: hypothetical protein ABI769_09930 [Pseudomonadota bacterium]